MAYIISIQLTNDCTNDRVHQIIDSLHGSAGVHIIIINGNISKTNEDITRLLVTEFVCDNSRVN